MVQSVAPALDTFDLAVDSVPRPVITAVWQSSTEIDIAYVGPPPSVAATLSITRLDPDFINFKDDPVYPIQGFVWYP